MMPCERLDRANELADRYLESDPNCMELGWSLADHFHELTEAGCGCYDCGACHPPRRLVEALCPEISAEELRAEFSRAIDLWERRGFAGADHLRKVVLDVAHGCQRQARRHGALLVKHAVEGLLRGRIELTEAELHAAGVHLVECTCPGGCGSGNCCLTPSTPYQCKGS